MPRTDGVDGNLGDRMRYSVDSHTGWEDATLKWDEWLEYMKRKDDKGNSRRLHRRIVEKMIKSAEGSAGLLHKITKPTKGERGVQILEKEEEDATKRKA